MKRQTFIFLLSSATFLNAAITLTPNHFVSDAEFQAAYENSPVNFQSEVTAIGKIGNSADGNGSVGDWEIALVDPDNNEIPFTGTSSNPATVGSSAQEQFSISNGTSYNWFLEYDIGNSNRATFNIGGEWVEVSNLFNTFNAFAIRTRGISSAENTIVTPGDLTVHTPDATTVTLPAPDLTKFDGVGADYYAFADLDELANGFRLTGTMTINWDANDRPFPDNAELAFQIKLGTTAPGVTPVPEPQTFALLAGLFSLGWMAMRRRGASGNRG